VAGVNANKATRATGPFVTWLGGGSNTCPKRTYVRRNKTREASSYLLVSQLVEVLRRITSDMRTETQQHTTVLADRRLLTDPLAPLASPQRPEKQSCPKKLEPRSQRCPYILRRHGRICIPLSILALA